MQPATPGPLGRAAVVGLVLLFIASGCAAFAATEGTGSAGESRPGTLAALPADPFARHLSAGASPLAVDPATSDPGSGDPVLATEPAARTEHGSPSPASESPFPGPSLAPAVRGTGDDTEVKRKPKVKTIRLKPRPKPGPFSMNLYSKGDFVHQQTKDWCVAASTQTMMNIIDNGRPNRSTAFQKRLYVKGRRLSPNKAKLGAIGIDLTGWAELLDRGGYGPYVVDGARSRKRAIKMAAKAIRETGRPVGLVVWRGAHSWVMSGFSATADPAHTNRFKVTSVYIQDVWYPYVSTIWGASRPPNAKVPVAALGEDYLRYSRPRARYPKRDGKFMLILPRLPRNTVAR